MRLIGQQALPIYPVASRSPSDPPRVLSLQQPWATLVAHGAKLIETRSWRTQFRGPLLIHASATIPYGGKQYCAEEPFASTLAGLGYASWRDLPTGAILCQVELFGCRSTNTGALPPDDLPERAFGNFARNRYMFDLREPRRLATPVACKGTVRPLLWLPSEETWQEIQRQLGGEKGEDYYVP